MQSKQRSRVRLVAVPLYLKEANEFIAKYHRHSIPTVGCRFATGVSKEVDPGKLVGVAICGRPVARRADNGSTLEVLRVCTDGTPNACSFLYGVCRQIGKLMGYRSVITYTLKSESGTSLRAVGGIVVGEVENGNSDWTNRPGRKKQLVVKEPKWKWELLNVAACVPASVVGDRNGIGIVDGDGVDCERLRTAGLDGAAA